MNAKNPSKTALLLPHFVMKITKCAPLYFVYSLKPYLLKYISSSSLFLGAEKIFKLILIIKKNSTTRQK